MLSRPSLCFSKSCTIVINGQVRCIRDGEWKNCEVCGRDGLLRRRLTQVLPIICNTDIFLNCTLFMEPGSLLTCSPEQEGHTPGDFERIIEREFRKLNPGGEH